MNTEIIFSAKEYEKKYNSLLESYLSNGYEDLDQIDFIESEILIYGKYKNILFNFHTSNFMSGRTRPYTGSVMSSQVIYYDNIQTQIRKKLYGIDNKYNNETYLNINISFEKIIKFLNLQKLNPTPTKTNSIQTPKTNKSLLFEGKNLNMSERYQIANKVLDIDTKIRTLKNISDSDKHQLLAYILGIDKDNARHLMNGAYNSKDRDLTDYFNRLDLNK